MVILGLTAETNMTPEYLGDLIVQTLKNNGLDKYHLISNSLGGWISLEMAAKYPDQVLSVTALAPAGLWHRPRTSRGLLLSFNRYLAVIAGNHIDKLVKYKFIRKIRFRCNQPEMAESFI
jgi:pimeloyl-ACP methyl ester carboxylesterase